MSSLTDFSRSFHSNGLRPAHRNSPSPPTSQAGERSPSESPDRRNRSEVYRRIIERGNLPLSEREKSLGIKERVIEEQGVSVPKQKDATPREKNASPRDLRRDAEELEVLNRIRERLALEEQGVSVPKEKDAATKSSDFFKHITISRDQTKGRRNLDEQQQLRALLEKNTGITLRPFDLRGSLGAESADVPSKAPPRATPAPGESLRALAQELIAPVPYQYRSDPAGNEHSLLEESDESLDTPEKHSRIRYFGGYRPTPHYQRTKFSFSDSPSESEGTEESWPGSSWSSASAAAASPDELSTEDSSTESARQLTPEIILPEAEENFSTDPPDSSTGTSVASKEVTDSDVSAVLRRALGLADTEISSESSSTMPSESRYSRGVEGPRRSDVNAVYNRPRDNQQPDRIVPSSQRRISRSLIERGPLSDTGRMANSSPQSKSPIPVDHEEYRYHNEEYRDEEESMPSDRGSSPALEEGSITGRIKELTAELEALKAQLGEKPGNVGTLAPFQSSSRSTPWRIIYRVKGRPYLGEPQWQHTRKGIRLVASMPVRDLQQYTERHPDILFIVFKTYRSDALPSDDETTELDVYPPPVPTTESIRLSSNDMTQALKDLMRTYSDSEVVFHDYDPKAELKAPYLILFHMFPDWEENVLRLEEHYQECVKKLFGYLRQIYVPRYQRVLERFEAGITTRDDLVYFVKPGDIIVLTKPKTMAFMAMSWPTSLGIYSTKQKGKSPRHKGKDPVLGSRVRVAVGGASSSNNSEEEDDLTDSRNRAPKEKKDSYEIWTVMGWNWSFNGGRLCENSISVQLYINPHTAGDVDINSLDFYPLKYARDETKELLLKRGHNFWRCRQRQFVGYSHAEEDAEDLESAHERFMIDFSTYRRLHPESDTEQPETDPRRREQHGTYDTDIMAEEDPPKNETIYLFPSTLIGYNLRLKKWVNIEVDRIRDVDWNKKAFESLVVDDETKHLVKALISNQIKTEKSTDLMSGKGNGLIILLHGGPGTGKTFTAESVAELAEKPLYRVTCGDIGTKPEDVEKYLESVLLLGKIWGCVVLLDEADVFLEERTLMDLKRNALVSVFLRVLEYYDGILILTSNRVGTFDQAFKSRIQLALHYENLKTPQRRKIWRNFFNRLKDVGETAVDYDDLGDHIDELAKMDMNGRQIRNAITTARQMAQFDGQDFSYKQLQHVIKVASKFESYLKDVRGYSDDEMARQEMTR
ncbi:hypothetical protein GGR56DRAFT_433186 [Xylariaceae sp. FL0804]|nr:hypothetical protein GGR56DRAFT_433186 [Xylariaceae sp. FL0804]